MPFSISMIHFLHLQKTIKRQSIYVLQKANSQIFFDLRIQQLFNFNKLFDIFFRDLNLTTLQNMTMEKQLTYLFNSMKLKGQANFHLTTEYHGEETLLLMMQYLEDIMMLEILSSLDFQWQPQSQSLHGVVSISR